MGKQEGYQETVSESSDDEEDEEPEKRRKHYSSKQRMVLFGEGDFFFSLSLAKSFGSACNLVPTSFYTQGIFSFLSFTSTCLRVSIVWLTKERILNDPLRVCLCLRYR